MRQKRGLNIAQVNSVHGVTSPQGLFRNSVVLFPQLQESPKPFEPEKFPLPVFDAQKLKPKCNVTISPSLLRTKYGV